MPVDHHKPTPLPDHASAAAHAERKAVLAAEAAHAEASRPAPAVALRYTGPAGSFVPGLPTEGTGPHHTLTGAEVAARFTYGQYTALLKAGTYSRVDPPAKADTPPATPAKKEAP